MPGLPRHRRLANGVSRGLSRAQALRAEQEYIVLALKEYKNGNRGHPTMKAIAASLNDGDMADIAAYYSQSPLTTAAK